MSDRPFFRPYSVKIPAGFREAILPVEGNFFFINETPVILSVELKGYFNGGIMEFGRMQGFRSKANSFRFLQITRSTNDTSADVEYTANITAGTLPEGNDFFT